jgi:hypothetical protein
MLAHVIRRCRAVAKLGPGGLQSWAEDVITVLRDAHKAVEAARARGATALAPETLLGLEERYDQAISTGIIHNRLRDWHDGNHPGYALGRWLRDYPRPLVPHKKLPRLRRRPRPHLAGSHYRRALSGRPWLPAVPAAARPASQ